MIRLMTTSVFAVLVASFAQAQSFGRDLQRFVDPSSKASSLNREDAAIIARVGSYLGSVYQHEMSKTAIELSRELQKGLTAERLMIFKGIQKGYEAADAEKRKSRKVVMKDEVDVYWEKNKGAIEQALNTVFDKAFGSQKPVISKAKFNDQGYEISFDVTFNKKKMRISHILGHQDISVGPQVNRLDAMAKPDVLAETQGPAKQLDAAFYGNLIDLTTGKLAADQSKMLRIAGRLDSSLQYPENFTPEFLAAIDAEMDKQFAKVSGEGAGAAQPAVMPAASGSGGAGSPGMRGSGTGAPR